MRLVVSLSWFWRRRASHPRLIQITRGQPRVFVSDEGGCCRSGRSRQRSKRDVDGERKPSAERRLRSSRVQLNVMPFDAATAAMYKAMCIKKTREGLNGLGDVACWYNDKHRELQVLKGLTMFSIDLSKSGDSTEAIKGVARKVYERVK